MEEKQTLLITVPFKGFKYCKKCGNKTCWWNPAFVPFNNGKQKEKPRFSYRNGIVTCKSSNASTSPQKTIVKMGKIYISSNFDSLTIRQTLTFPTIELLKNK